mgnify:CR=1 FL=1
MLLNDKEAFKVHIKDFVLKQELKEKRQKKFSVRINTSRISVVLFGKQVLELGK